MERAVLYNFAGLPGEIPSFDSKLACSGGQLLTQSQGYLQSPPYDRPSQVPVKEVRRCSWTLTTNNSAKVIANTGFENFISSELAFSVLWNVCATLCAHIPHRLLVCPTFLPFVVFLSLSHSRSIAFFIIFLCTHQNKAFTG